MKKAIISLVILILCAGTVFYFGWVQFAVPTGSCGVMISKTSGVHPKPIVSGEFAWCWERLLPTNTNLLVFNLEPITVSDTLSATLPSGGTYSAMLQGTPDFSYSVTIKTRARIRPESIVPMVEQNDLQNQSDLDEAMRTLIKQFNSAAVEFLLLNAQKNTETLSLQPLSTEEIVAGTNAVNQFSEIEILAVETSNIKIPDMALYEFARKVYMQTQAQLENIPTTSEPYPAPLASSSKVSQFDSLVELGEILTKYPVLLDLLKEKEIGSILDSLDRKE